MKEKTKRKRKQETIREYGSRDTRRTAPNEAWNFETPNTSTLIKKEYSSIKHEKQYVS